MKKSTSEIGVITAIVERLENQRLPKLFAMKQKLDEGKPLDDTELDFLEKTMVNGREVMAMIDKHPEYQELATKVMALYKEIIDKALQLEKRS